MDFNEEELFESNKQSSRQSLIKPSSDYQKSPSMADEESDIKKSISSKEATSEEDEEDNSTVDKFDSNYDNFRPSHTSIDYNLEKPDEHLTVPSNYQAPSSSKKGRSLSIASVLSPLSPSNSPNINKNIPQFLTVSPTFTPRARPPPAYLGNYTGGLSSLTGPNNAINNSSINRMMNPSLAVGGQMPSFQAAKGGILGSATSQLLNSRSRHQSIDSVKISTGNNQVLSSHLARKRQSVVSAKILETLATANANYSGCRRLVRGKTCYGSGSGPSTNYFSPGRLTENLKESYDEEQDDLKENLFENAYTNSEDPKHLIEKNASLETPFYKQRSSILTSNSNTTGEEKENQFDEETINNKNDENLIEHKTTNEHVKISFDASNNEKLSKINENDIGNNSDQEDEPEAPTLSLGERIVWVKTAGPEYGTVRWIGRMPKVSTKWTIGVEFDNAIGSGDGIIDGKRFFNSKDNYAKFLPLASVTKLEAYLARPRSGTLLSRMSVQLKPGQLISVQRTPSINHIPVHCALNAPHHIDHDVHKTNMQHCLCNNCNHPCAHLCHTKNYKGSKKKERAHMCHFSQKPHNKLCCGGEDLRHLIASGKLEKAGGLLQEVKENEIKVAAAKSEKLASIDLQKSKRSSSGSRVSSTIGGHAVGSVGSAAIGAGFNTVVVSKQDRKRNGQLLGQPISLTPPPPPPPPTSPLPRSGLNPSHDSSTLGRDSRRKNNRYSVNSNELPTCSAPSSVEQVSTCSFSSCSKAGLKASKNSISNNDKINKPKDLKLSSLRRSDSDISISSLPSTTSPVEVYIARGALTDESDCESDAKLFDSNKNQINNQQNKHHIVDKIDKEFYEQTALSHQNSTIYPSHHHRSAIRSMFSCLIGRSHNYLYNESNRENYPQRYSNYNYYDEAGLDGCVRRKKSKKTKKKNPKKKRSCHGQNNYCYYCSSHNTYTSSQAPSRVSNNSTTTSLHTASKYSNNLNSLTKNNFQSENTSFKNTKNESSIKSDNKKDYLLNVKNSCGLSPSPEPNSQQPLLSNYSNPPSRASSNSNSIKQSSISSSTYRDYRTNYCSKTLAYNHSCHPECAQNISSHDSKEDIKEDLNTITEKIRSNSVSPMKVCSSPSNIAKNIIQVTAETHEEIPSTNKDINSQKNQSNQELLQNYPSKMDFVEQLHQFQQQYLKQHPEVCNDDKLVQVATECNDRNNNELQTNQQVRPLHQPTESTPVLFSGSVGSDGADLMATLNTILPIKTEEKNEKASMSNENDIQTLSLYNFKTSNIQKAKNSVPKKSDNFSDINYNITKSSKVSSQDSLLTSSVSSTSVFYDHVSQNNVKPTTQTDLEKKNNLTTSSRIKQDIKTDSNIFIDKIDLKSIDDSTSFSMLSLNSNQTSNLSSENQTSSNKINSSSLSQSQASVFSDSNKTSCSKTPLDSVTTSSSSINSFSSSNPQNTSSTISGLVSFSPCKRRKKPPAPKPPGFKDKNQKHESSNTDLSKNNNVLDTKTSSKVPKTLNDLNLSSSKSNLSTKLNDKNIVSQNLINSSNSNSLPYSVDIKTFKKRKKSSKTKPAPGPPVSNSNLTDVNKNNQNNLLKSKLSEKNTKTLKPKIKNLSLNNVPSCLRPNNSNNTTPSISASSTHYSTKFNVKQRLNAILNRSLSEAFKLNAKAALSSVQHSFSSEVNLNKKNIFSFMNNTAFNDSFSSEQQVTSPVIIEKNTELKKDLKNSDINNIEKNCSSNNKKETFIKASNVKSSSLNFNVMDDAILSIASYSDKLVNQLFTTQSVQCELKNRSFSMPYLVFLPMKNENTILPVNINKSKTRKQKSAFNLANDLIIETLSKNLYNGSADQLLYAAELLEEFSDNNIVAVPPLSSTLAALISPNHYKKHNLNNQLLLINHYVDCLKHEQEQEELLTVQLIEQQQVDKMFVEVSKKSTVKIPDVFKKSSSTVTVEELNEKNFKNKVLTSNSKIEKKKILPNETLVKCEEKIKKDIKDCDIKPEKVESFVNSHNDCTKIYLNSSHESSAGSDELHSDTSDGKVTVKSMHTNRLANLPISTNAPVNYEKNSKNTISENIKQENKDRKKLIKSLNSNSSASINHHEYDCTRHNFLKRRPCCLEHSQSTYCLNEHFSCGHISNESEETSSSSSSQSTRSTEESIVLRHKHQNCLDFNTQKFCLEKNLTHSLRRNLNKNYLNSSFSDFSSDDTFSNNKSPQLFFSQNKCFHHSNINLADQNLCSCCIHSYDLKQGSLPTKYPKNNLSFKETRLPENLCKNEELYKISNNELSQNYFCQQKNFPDKISRLYDYHCSQLEDMFKPENNEINNELTDLMDQLEIAISSGEHKKAAILARELALRKVTCSLQRSKKENVISQPIVVYLYIEDQKTHQGPIPIQVFPTMTVKALKLKIEKEFGFHSSMQKWILGKSLASNEDASLLTYGVTSSGWPIFLYLFNSEEIHHNKNNLLVNINQKNPGLFGMKEVYENHLEDFSKHSLNNINKLNLDIKSHDLNILLEKNLNQKSIKKTELNYTKSTSYRYEQENILIDDEQDFFPPPPPPIMFQSTNDDDIKNFLTDVEPTTWVNNKLHESVKIKKNKLNNDKKIYKKVDDEIDEYESANENLLEDDNSIEEILIEEEIYENEDKKSLDFVKQKEKKHKETTKIYQGYNELINLNNVSLVKSTDQFECPVCLNNVEQNEGIVLKNCLHSFCKNCLIYCVEHCDQITVNCPFNSDLYQCESEISPQEIRALLKDNLKILENHLNKSVKIVSMNKLVFQCKKPSCDGFTFYENSAKWFLCPICTTLYCLRCQLAHDENQICKGTEEEKQKELSEDEKKSELFINDLIKRNQALYCPKCEVLVMKKWGCDWVKCFMCKTEICWVTKKARWGPAGKGDTSDGCKCMVNNIKCHPKCNYCH